MQCKGPEIKQRMKTKDTGRLNNKLIHHHFHHCGLPVGMFCKATGTCCQVAGVSASEIYPQVPRAAAQSFSPFNWLVYGPYTFFTTFVQLGENEMSNHLSLTAPSHHTGSSCMYGEQPSWSSCEKYVELTSAPPTSSLQIRRASTGDACPSFIIVFSTIDES